MTIVLPRQVRTIWALQKSVKAPAGWGTTTGTNDPKGAKEGRNPPSLVH